MRWWSAGECASTAVSEHPLADVPGVLEGLGARRVTGKPVALLR